MPALDSEVARLRRFNAGIDAHRSVSNDEILDEAFVTGGPPLETAFEEESIILRTRRPVLAVCDDAAELVFEDAEEAKLWKGKLANAKQILQAACRAIGRIELAGHEELAWIGTGWLVAPDVLVTNRHVALGFAERDPLVFRAGPNSRISADIDFKKEFGRDLTRLFKIKEPLYIEPPGGPDLAFFRVERSTNDDSLSAPITLSSRPIEGIREVAVIGYPARDSRIPDQPLMDRLYGERYDKKRLAPGEVTGVEGGDLLHNCTTLGGNSGSAVVDLASGFALGLHFSGRFLTTNYAVRAEVVAQRLAQLNNEKARARSVPTPMAARRSARSLVATTQATDLSATLTVPLTITLTLGSPLASNTPASRRAPRSARPVTRSHPSPDAIAEEAKPADYKNRKGYVADFLGPGLSVPLPDTSQLSDEVLRFDEDGRNEIVLRYQHFSVVMSGSRRMCLFSAVNIDGARSRKTKRAGWRTDPRIAKDAQILNECYGDPPMFSRGHMTRREDPAWGDEAAAQRGNVDSMHVTNATPQMQAFNSPIWLELEDYALQNARSDDMKISVFTGPYFDYDGRADPVIDGVTIPRVFWKIIVFVHDETGELCATGYELSQEDNLPADEEEFIFDDLVSSYVNRSTQVSIASIEQRTRLSFGSVADFDPLASGDEGRPTSTSLERLEQIRFR